MTMISSPYLSKSSLSTVINIIIHQTISQISLENNEYQDPHQAIRQSFPREKAEIDRGWKYDESEGQLLRRDIRLRALQKRVIQILYSIMQINMRCIKLSLEFVGWWRKKEGDRSGERFLCFFGNKSLPAPIYLFLSLVSSLESESLHPRSVLWLTDAVTSGDMPLFQKDRNMKRG